MPPEKNLPLVTRDAGEGQKSAEMAAMQRMAGNLRILAESIKPGSTGNKEITFDELGRIAVEQRQLHTFFESHLRTLLRGILGTGELNPKRALEEVERLKKARENNTVADSEGEPDCAEKENSLVVELRGQVDVATDKLNIVISEIESLLENIPEKFRVTVRPEGGVAEPRGSLIASVMQLVKAANAAERGEELMQRTRKLGEMVEIATAPGNFDCSPYLYGMANMGIFAMALLNNVECRYLEPPKKWKEKDPLGVSPPVEAAMPSGEKAPA